MEPHVRRTGGRGPVPLLGIATSLALVFLGCGGAGSGGVDSGREASEAATSRDGPVGVEARDRSSPDQTPGPTRGQAWVLVGTDTVRVEVASTPEQRRQGLMFREELPAGTGMLFVFEAPAIRSFWMENTLVPLDIAFIDVSQRIVEIQQMEPETTDLHSSSSPILFALEVPRGWFSERGIRVGDGVEIVFGPR